MDCPDCKRRGTVSKTETTTRIKKECSECSYSSDLPKRSAPKGPVAGWPK